MTQPKPATGRDPAQDDPSPAQSQPGQPLPFTPPKTNPQAAGSSAAQPSQPIQFTPARTPAPGPQAPPPQPPAAPPAAETPITVKRKRGGTGRFVMLVIIPLVALALGFTWWLSSGRYVSTDNAYVGADKSLITPQVTGAIVAVHVAEGQKVKVGDPLFDIDPQPYEIALALARGRVDAAKVEFANLQVLVPQQRRADQNGRGRGGGAPDRLRPQERPRHARHRNHGRSRHFDGQSHPGEADPRVCPPATGDGGGEARRRPGRVDRELPRLHAGEGRPRGRRTQPAQHQGRRADRRRGDAGARRSRLGGWRRRVSRCSRSSPILAYG